MVAVRRVFTVSLETFETFERPFRSLRLDSLRHLCGD